MLTDPSFIYLATILPPILLGIIIWKSDKFPEPGKFLIASFLLGVSIILPLDLFIMITEDHIAPMLGLDLEALKLGMKVLGKKKVRLFLQQRELL